MAGEKKGGVSVVGVDRPVKLPPFFFFLTYLCDNVPIAPSVRLT